MPSFTHVDDSGQPGMVDISAKAITPRSATAGVRVVMPREVFEALVAEGWATGKGSILQTARIAGTMAVKRTADLIPFCHPLPIQKIKFIIEEEPALPGLRIEATVATDYRTGVEMEALTGASVAALTIYDMCKALTPELVVDGLRLLRKTGGKEDYTAAPDPA
ncbi:MAG: cyclic pyranopterin monophosphate synthase MoaC [Verrucomicrobiota bacterium]